MSHYPGRMRRRSPGATRIAEEQKKLLAAFSLYDPLKIIASSLLLGAIASPYELAPRAGFAVGASMASVVWFAALGYGARWLAPVFSTPKAWRVLDGVIAATMLVLAVGLLQSAVW